MKNSGHLSRRPIDAAFTLIELIVVIAIIGILASLIFPIVGAVNKQKLISTAKTQLKAVEAAIDGYKTKLGFYPPDSPNGAITNQLYFELMGTTNNGAGQPAPTLWVTVDGSAQIGTTTSPNITAVFNISGMANTSTRAHSDDSGAAATTFINNLTPNQVGVLDLVTAPQVKLLVCSVPWPTEKTPYPLPGDPGVTPFCYNSSHPTNNTASYDLWVDVVVKGKTNRVCNWSTQPIVL
ncbi:MAG TPA: prepilin-type N-terminal cleavage/methylation domain-containing protein [Verrucomicrobiae bacterium]|jgi:prepilin-type N-terminal cleavage/methylation domain-containing protein|nr:prepilin-type N-terminal cleavage/methylation domain-containing protein [Verrucomicrobiae bacterium]